MGFWYQAFDVAFGIDVVLAQNASDVLPAAKHGVSYLEDLDGTPCRGGVIKVVLRPWENGIGGSFRSFDYIVQKMLDEYEYWFFAEDNVQQITSKYFKMAIEQLSSSKNLAFVGCDRNTTMEISQLHHPRHAHGGCGCTHRRFLKEVLDKNGSLPYSNVTLSEQNVRRMMRGEFDFNSKDGISFYRAFEQEGEVRFTNVYIQLGHNIEDLNYSGYVTRWHQVYG